MTGQIFGYARVSTADQDLSIQEQALKNAGCDNVRSEKKSGSTIHGRSELSAILEFSRRGDVLVVTRIDRLARSTSDLLRITGKLEDKGVILKVLEQQIDTSSAAGRAFLQMLGVFAEFENSIRRERQLEGIAKAKEKGVYKGRTPTIDGNKIRALSASGLGATAIAKQLGIGRASVYRVLKRND